MKVAVADTSPLIVLSRSGFLDCLADLFSKVQIPRSVFDEICVGPPEDPTRSHLSDCPWLEWVRLQPPPETQACPRLGRGETEVIELARLNPGSVAILDDRAARRVAKSLEIPVVGTLGVVAASLFRKKTFSFDEAVARLREAGLYVDVELVEAVRKTLDR